MVRSVGGHQTHAVTAAGCGEMTHCGPLVLCRVVQEHLVNSSGASPATCRIGITIIIMFNIVQHSPVITNRPWSSPTPLTACLAEGRLATSCQALPPSFSRISVDAKLELPLYPPLTIYTCINCVNINISPQYSALYNGVFRGCILATGVAVSAMVEAGK